MPLSDPLLYGVHARFWQQPNLLVFALAGAALQHLCGASPYSSVSSSSRRRSIGSSVLAWSAALAAAALAVVQVSAARRWHAMQSLYL
jgi:ferric-dicitrate binding protein FerR (iron transport regulator)